VLHGRAVTIFVDTPSSAVSATLVREPAWPCSAKPLSPPGAVGGVGCPVSGGEGVPVVRAGPELTQDALQMPVVLPVLKTDGKLEEFAAVAIKEVPAWDPLASVTSPGPASNQDNRS
jgi:hypothetical protein